MTERELLRSIRFWLIIFIVGLILSGITAFPLEHETAWAAHLAAHRAFVPASVAAWLDRVHLALDDESMRYPFLAYGTDWLAFAHIMLAVAFLGPMRDPARNKWVLQLA